MIPRGLLSNTTQGRDPGRRKGAGHGKQIIPVEGGPGHGIRARPQTERSMLVVWTTDQLHRSTIVDP